MDNLINRIKRLKNTEIENTIKKRIKEFKDIDKKSKEELFQEMCFCLLTANFNAEKSIKIQRDIGKCFSIGEKKEISEKLKKRGHRFPNKRAEYIYNSKKCKNQLLEVVNHHDKNAIREWLVKNIKGLGYKESSHFLRNIGFDDYAIIDFHIIDILEKYDIIKRPKTITKKSYLEIEEKLREIARKTSLSLAELDLYLWYMETGKILK